jgi:hypothetical protein
MTRRTPALVRTAIAAAAIAALAPSWAATDTWTFAGSGDWDVGSNWSSAPASGDAVVISIAGLNTITYQQDTLSCRQPVAGRRQHLRVERRQLDDQHAEQHVERQHRRQWRHVQRRQRQFRDHESHGRNAGPERRPDGHRGDQSERRDDQRREDPVVGGQRAGVHEQRHPGRADVCRGDEYRNLGKSLRQRHDHERPDAAERERHAAGGHEPGHDRQRLRLCHVQWDADLRPCDGQHGHGHWRLWLSRGQRRHADARLGPGGQWQRPDRRRHARQQRHPQRQSGVHDADPQRYVVERGVDGHDHRAIGGRAVVAGGDAVRPAS